MIDPILITGCARSGTSMVAGIVSICGAFGGDVTGKTRYNKKGQFENIYIRNSIVKPYLTGIECDPLGQNPLPEIEPMKHLPLSFVIDWKKRVERTFREQGYKGGPWFYKGAKMCMMWPIWHYAFPKAKWIIVRRKDKEIINSCLKTGFMKAYKNTTGWQKWVDQHKVHFVEMRYAGLDVIEIWPQEMVNGDFTSIKRLIRIFKLNWKEKDVLEFITPALWSSGVLKKGD